MKKLLIFLTGLSVITSVASPVGFSGSVSADASYILREGAELDRQPFTWTVLLVPTFTFWEVPLSFRFMLSSYDVATRQPFNRIGFSAASLGFQVLGFSAPRLGVQILDCRPFYSSYSLHGINVRGGAVDLKPGLFRLSVTAGQTQRGVTGSDSSDVAYRRWLYAGRIGIGKDAESHLHFHLLKAWDDSTSIPPYLGAVTDGSTTDTVELSSPVENSVASLEGRLNLLHDKLTFEGELAGSAYNRDLRAASLEIEQLSWLPTFMFQPRMTTQAGWAAKIGSELTLGQTAISVGFEQIGWGFKSLGVSFLDSDIRTWNAALTQTFTKPFSMSFYASAELGRDNLADMKSVVTRTQSAALNFGFYPRTVPSLTLGYVPFRRTAPASADGLTDEVSDITHTFWASSAYRFKIGERWQTASLSFAGSVLDDKIDTLRDFNSMSVNLRASHAVASTLTLRWNAGTGRNLTGQRSKTRYSAGLGTTLSLIAKRWRTSLDGFFDRIAKTPEVKGTLRLTSEFDFFRNFTVKLVGRFAGYSGYTPAEDYTEVETGLGLSYRW
ncbi:hypothetical protein JXM67_11470 [candidate division WOR-3 bacterium]|nr:hypothetical protein [candidate division WOR-3 bacterium]